MPETEPAVPEAPTSTLTCGNCGAAVTPDAVMCPACGVLLAAYQVAGGSGPSDPLPAAQATAEPPVVKPPETSETGVTPSPYATPGIADPVIPPETSETGATPSADAMPSFTMPAFSTPPDHTPRSQSPIGDALRTSSESGIGRGVPDTHGHSRYMVEMTRMGSPAAELTVMAEGVDELADMSDGVDELSDMAGGNDELSSMAGTGSGLAAEVEAELAGARVRFAGNRPVIESEVVEVVQTPGDAPAVVTPKPAPARPTPRAPMVERRQQEQVASRTGVYDTPVSHVIGAEAPTPASRPKNPGVGPWIPLVLLVCVVLVFARIVPAAGGILGLILVAALVWGLLKWTSATNRKTTAMPKDKDWNRKRPRF